MGFQRSCPPELVLPPHFINIVLKAKASRPPHVLKLWMDVGKCMLTEKYFCSTKPFLSQSNFMQIIRLLQRQSKIWPTSVVGYYRIYDSGICLQKLAPHI